VHTQFVPAAIAVPDQAPADVRTCRSANVPPTDISTPSACVDRMTHRSKSKDPQVPRATHTRYHSSSQARSGASTTTHPLKACGRDANKPRRLAVASAAHSDVIIAQPINGRNEIQHHRLVRPSLSCSLSVVYPLCPCFLSSSKRGDFNLGEIGHYYFGLTVVLLPVY